MDSNGQVQKNNQKKPTWQSFIKKNKAWLHHLYITHTTLHILT